MFKKSTVFILHYTQPAFYSQSAVCILHSVCILPVVCSQQSAFYPDRQGNKDHAISLCLLAATQPSLAQ